MHIVWSIAFCVLFSTPLHAATLIETKKAPLVGSHFTASATWTKVDHQQGPEPDTLMDPVKAVHLLGLHQNALYPVAGQEVTFSLPPVIQTLQFKVSFREIKRMSLYKPVLLPKRQRENSIYEVAAPPTIFALVAAVLALPILQRGPHNSRKRWRYQRFHS